MNLPPKHRSNAALVEVIQHALVVLPQSGANGAASYMGRHHVPQEVITRILRFPAFRRAGDGPAS
jgi:hypothetical protein